MKVHVDRTLAVSMLLVLFECILDIVRVEAPHCVDAQVANVQFGWELIEDGRVGVLVFLDHRYHQRYQFGPKFKIIWAGAFLGFFVFLFVPWTRALGFIFSGIEVIAIFKQKLICRTYASFGTVLHHRTCARWAGQLEYFHPKEGNTCQQIDGRL